MQENSKWNLHKLMTRFTAHPLQRVWIILNNFVFFILCQIIYAIMYWNRAVSVT
jgi:hypothetical protein